MYYLGIHLSFSPVTVHYLPTVGQIFLSVFVIFFSNKIVSKIVKVLVCQQPNALQQNREQVTQACFISFFFFFFYLCEIVENSGRQVMITFNLRAYLGR